MSFILYSVLPITIETPMFFSSLSMWKLVKDAPNHIPMNIIGLAQTSRKMLKDSGVPIFLVFINTPDSL